jgi:hypothetical protein
LRLSELNVLLCALVAPANNAGTQQVGRTVEVTQARDFRELWSLTVGSGSAWCVDFMIMGVAAGALLVYSCFLGEILASVLGGGRLFLFYLIRCFGAAPACSHF